MKYVGGDGRIAAHFGFWIFWNYSTKIDFKVSLPKLHFKMSPTLHFDVSLTKHRFDMSPNYVLFEFSLTKLHFKVSLTNLYYKVSLTKLHFEMWPKQHFDVLLI